MTTKEISNMDDVIDSLDVIARIEALEEERGNLELNLEDAEDAEAKEQALAAIAEWDESDEGKELKILKALAEEASGYAADWSYGEVLIRDSYFETYAQELAEDCGMLDDKVSSSWPYTCIDWERAARELQMDYTSVEFDGIMYWVR